MLTLKAPIQLHIAQELTGNAEAFGERIRGNYDLLGAHFAAKDLLFLMTAPPELPEDLGGMTTLVQQQNTVDARSITMDVVNHVVNRILLDGTEQFTYQDQVYITTVLNRLGITNTAQFMEQVRQLRVENESTVHMMKLYREELERILQRQAAGEAAPALPLPAAKEEETPTPARDPRVTLCMEILNRLETANLYETVHAFQRSWTGGVNMIRNQELKLSEQLRFSNAVSLAEIKQQIYQQPGLRLLHHLNAYETDGLLEAPKDEDEVLSHAAAAALMTAVDNTVVEVLNRPSFRQEQWVQVKNALWQVAENTLSRFETYHSQPQPSVDLSVRMDMAWNNYAQELREYQALYRQMYPKAADSLAPLPGRGEGGRTFLTHLTESERTEETLSERNTVFRETDTEKHFIEGILREDQQQVLRELTEPGVRAFRRDPAPDGEALHLTYRSENREGDQLQYQENVEILHTHGQPPVAAERTEAPEGRIAKGEMPADREILLRRERDRQLAGERLREVIQRQLRQGNTPSAMPEEMPPVSPVFPSQAETRLDERPGGGVSERMTEREKRFAQETTQEFQRQTLRELLERTGGQLPAAAAPGDTLQLTHWEQSREGDLYQNWESETQVSAGGIRRETEIRQGLPPLRWLWPPEPLSRSERILREYILREESRQLRETRETALPLPQARERAEQAMPRLELRERPVPQSAPLVPPVPMTLREAEEQAPEVLLEEMTRIDQHNRTVLQAVQEEDRKREARLPPGPDIRRTMRDALRALEEPERVLREVLTAREERAATVHPELTPQEEALLRQAAPEERAVYEAVLAYQKDPEGALARGLLQPGNMGALHAALQEAAREEPLELKHPGEEALRQRELLREQSETVLEQFRRLPSMGRPVPRETKAPSPAVKMVHKQASPDIAEELLEQLEEQRTRSTVRTEMNEQVNRQQSHRVDVNQMERKVVAQTAEDITELVNRTLARQMRTISDQVYRQMEKRLQTERSRRGRL